MNIKIRPKKRKNKFRKIESELNELSIEHNQKRIIHN